MADELISNTIGNTDPKKERVIPEKNILEGEKLLPPPAQPVPVAVPVVAPLASSASSAPTPPVPPVIPVVLKPQQLTSTLSVPRGSSDPALLSSHPIGIPNDALQDIPQTLPNQNDLAKELSSVLGGSSHIDTPHISPTSELSAPRTHQGPLAHVRTYKDDLAGAVKKRQISVVGMIAAESDRSAKKQLGGVGEKTIRSSRWLIVGIVFLIVLGAAAAGAAYLFTRTQQPLSHTTAAPLIFANNIQTVAVGTDTGATLLQRLTTMRDQSTLSLGEITDVQLLKDDTTELSSQDFFAVLGAQVTGEFIRALGTRMMVGFHAFDRTQPFLLFTVTDYERAFSGMLLWERTLTQDTAPLFSPQSVLQTTASSTTDIPSFHDQVLKNVNARVLLREDGTTRLLYAFPRRDLLVITTNESTLREILSRLGQTAQ